MQKTVTTPKFFALALLILLSLPFANRASASSQFSFTGEAYSLENNDLLYIEHHLITQDKNGRYLRSQVEYKKPNGTLIASKTLDFSEQAFLPSLAFYDQRTGREITLTTDDKAIQITHKADGQNKQTKIKNDSTHPIVADAGFDRFVIHSWSKLLKGEELSFEILPLDRDEPIAFEIKKSSQRQNEVTIKIKPSNWIIGLLLEPIYLDYSLSEKHLLRYEGLTNIPAEEDGKVVNKHFEARIEYRY